MKLMFYIPHFYLLCYSDILFKNLSKLRYKDQQSIQSSTTPDQDTNEKETNSQLDTTDESQEVSPFPAGDHKAHINRRAQRHSKHKTEKT